MLIRQFSLRTLLIVITLAAGVSLLLSYAIQGRAWAFAIAAFLVMLAVGLAVQGLVFWLVWLFSRIIDRWPGRRSDRAAPSPTSQPTAGSSLG